MVRTFHTRETYFVSEFSGFFTLSRVGCICFFVTCILRVFLCYVVLFGGGGILGTANALTEFC